MAAVHASAPTTLTPPASSHDRDSLWANGHAAEDNDYAHAHHDDHIHSPAGSNFSSGAQMATQRMRTAGHSQDRWDDAADPEDMDQDATLLPAYEPDTQGSGSWRSQSPSKSRDSRERDDNYVLNPKQGEGDDQESKWIHRDKLAKIESQELQAAGLYIPRSRAPSKQRSRSSARRGTDASDQPRRSRSRKNSSAVEHGGSSSGRHAVPDISVPSWDLRTPEEIAEEEANAYFTTHGLRGGSRIPVAKTSPAPIPVDYLERGSPSTSRKYSESPEGDSGSLYDRPPPTMSVAKRGDSSSPKKSGNRKVSTATKNSSASARPKTRSGSSTGTRPSTRSGETSMNKQPEGDPPWLVNAYKPDPRLPPDQQLLPTVARRLQQEQWEKNGTHGDTYDKEFRPLNDRTFNRPDKQGAQTSSDEEGQQKDKEDPAAAGSSLSPPPPGAGPEWPLRPDAAARSQVPRPGSYSTMPRISDKPPSAPAASPLATNAPTMFNAQIEPQSPAAQRVPDEKEDAKKGGCGCCVVM